MQTLNRDPLGFQQKAIDAANWRELMALLQRKAYKAMTPAEIVELLPDLREMYYRVQPAAHSHASRLSFR